MKNAIKLIMIIVLGSLSYTAVYSQTTGEIRGTVTDEIKQPIPGATVQVFSDSIYVSGGITNEDGIYTIKNIPPGNYNIHISYTGYKKEIVKDISVSAGQKVGINRQMALFVIDGPPIVITAYEKTPINEGYSPVEYITLEKIQQGTGIKNDIVSIITNYGSDMIPTEDGKDLYVKGSRRGTTQYIVDGMKTANGFNVPGQAIANIVVIGSGVSAEYGDLTGGVVIITTKDYLTGLRQKRLMYDQYYEEQEYKNTNLVKKAPEEKESDQTNEPEPVKD